MWVKFEIGDTFKSAVVNVSTKQSIKHDIMDSMDDYFTFTLFDNNSQCTISRNGVIVATRDLFRPVASGGHKTVNYDSYWITVTKEGFVSVGRGKQLNTNLILNFCPEFSEVKRCYRFANFTNGTGVVRYRSIQVGKIPSSQLYNNNDYTLYYVWSNVIT